MNQTRLIAILGLVAWMTTQVASGQSQPAAAGLTLGLELSSATIGPLDPLKGRLVVTNTTGSSIEDAPFGLSDSTFVEYIAPGAAEWKAMVVPALNRLAGKYPVGGGPARLRLGAGESAGIDIKIIGDPYEPGAEGRMKYYFREPGNYRVRAGYRRLSGQIVYSDEFDVRVEPYQGADAEAAAWLWTRAVPHFMYDFDVYADDKAHETDDDAVELLRRFPNSRFAPYAKLFLARAYDFGLRTSKTHVEPTNPVRTAELASELKESNNPEVRDAARSLLIDVQRKVAAERETHSGSNPSTRP